MSRISDLAADLWILTETHEVIHPGREYDSAITLPSPRKPRPGEACAAIWSKWPILQRLRTHDEREAVCVEIEHPERRMIVYGSIIPWDGYKGPDGDSRRWEEHYKSIERHRIDWKELRQQFPEHGFIAGGDFNQNRDGTKWYGTSKGRSQLSQALIDAGLACVTEEDFIKSGKLTSRHSIDHICLDLETADQVTHVEVWEGTTGNGVRMSDHNGVVVELAENQR